LKGAVFAAEAKRRGGEQGLILNLNPRKGRGEASNALERREEWVKAAEEGKGIKGRDARYEGEERKKRGRPSFPL